MSDYINWILLALILIIDIPGIIIMLIFLFGGGKR